MTSKRINARTKASKLLSYVEGGGSPPPHPNSQGGRPPPKQMRIGPVDEKIKVPTKYSKQFIDVFSQTYMAGSHLMPQDRKNRNMMGSIWGHPGVNLT